MVKLLLGKSLVEDVLVHGIDAANVENLLSEASAGKREELLVLGREFDVTYARLRERLGTAGLA